MPIRHQQEDVEVLLMRFAPADATLIADNPSDSAIALGIGPKPRANQLASKRS
jgi:hypothetical protein